MKKHKVHRYRVDVSSSIRLWGGWVVAVTYAWGECVAEVYAYTTDCRGSWPSTSRYLILRADCLGTHFMPAGASYGVWVFAQTRAPEAFLVRMDHLLEHGHPTFLDEEGF